MKKPISNIEKAKITRQNALKWKITAIFCIVVIVLGIGYYFIEDVYYSVFERAYLQGQLDLISDMNLNSYFPLVTLNRTSNESKIIPVSLNEFCYGGKE